MERCDNCLKQFPEDKIATHFGYCRRNIKRCSTCGQMYDVNFVEEHQEQFHKKAKCQYCKRQFGTGEIESHKKTCTQKPKFCEYCQLNVPPLQFPAHLKQCQSRTKQCDKCNKAIANKQYLFHFSTCKGPVQEQIKPRNYGQHISDQRMRMGDYKGDYARVDYTYKPHEQRKDNYDLRKKAQQKPRGSSRNQYKIQKRQADPYKRNTGASNIPSRGSYGGTGVTGVSGTSSRNIPSSNAGGARTTGSTRKEKKQLPTYNYGYNKQEQKAPARDAGSRHINFQHNQKPLRQDPHKINNPQDYKKTSQKREEYKPSSYKPSYSSNTRGTGSTKVDPYKAPSRQSKPSSSQVPPKIFNPADYGGYQQQIPQQYYQQQFHHYSKPQVQPTNVNDGGLDNEDQELQKAILMSMGGGTKNKYNPNVPKQFQNQDIMNQSFYKDFDVQKQKALYQEAQSRNKKRY